MQVFNLKTNIRLQNCLLDDARRTTQVEFAQWVLDIGNGKLWTEAYDEEYEAGTIRIPDDMLLRINGDPIKTICQAVYVDFVQNYKQRMYLQKTAIVTPYNDTVDDLNDYMLSLLPGEMKTFLSCDAISKSASATEEQQLLYPT